MSDRTREVNWLNNEAETILLYDQDGSCGPERAEELVAFWEQNVTEKPEWFDQYDRNLLVKLVADKLA